MTLFLSNATAMFCAMVLIVCAAFRMRSNQKLGDFWFVMGISQFPVALINYVLNTIAAYRQIRIDFYLNFIDGFFFFPSNHIANFLNHHHWLKLVAGGTYLYWWVPVWVMLIALSISNLKRAWMALGTVILAGVLALPFYTLFPACGPALSFPNFPAIYRGPVISNLGRATDLPNCVPSVHFTVALLILWFLREWKWGRAFGTLNVLLTIIATLGLGEHYLIDLILAVPYTWLVLAIPERVAAWKGQKQGAFDAKVEGNIGDGAPSGERI